MIINGTITTDTEIKNLGLNLPPCKTVKDLIKTNVGTTCKYSGYYHGEDISGEFVLIEDAQFGNQANDKAGFNASAIKLGDQYEFDTDVDYSRLNYGTCKIYQLVWLLNDGDDADNVNWEYPDKIYF